MNNNFTSEFLPKLQKHLNTLGRKQKNIFNVFRIVILFFALQSTLYIIILLFTLPALISAQQPAWRIASGTDGTYIFDIEGLS